MLELGRWLQSIGEGVGPVAGDKCPICSVMWACGAGEPPPRLSGSLHPLGDGGSQEMTILGVWLLERLLAPGV